MRGVFTVPSVVIENPAFLAVYDNAGAAAVVADSGKL